MKNKRIKALCAVLGLSFLFSFAACGANPQADGRENSESPAASEYEANSPSEPQPEPIPQPQPEPEPKPEPEPEPKPKTKQYIYVKTNELNVRSKAGASSAIRGQADKGVSLVYLGTESGFYKTYYKNAVSYVSANENYTELYTMPVSNEETESVITEGCKLIGTPYVYGAVRYHDGYGKRNSGFTVAKFDCSSLTQYVFYKANGTLLQVNTRTQIFQGKHVEKSDLARGDLIFFTNDSRRYNTGIERVGHVAIYLGDNKILHTASDYCKIEEMTTKRWNYYIEARRMG